MTKVLHDFIDEAIDMLQRFKSMSEDDIQLNMRTLENTFKSISYFATYGNLRKPVEFHQPKSKAELVALHCSITGCINKTPLFNIKSGVPNNGTDWRCIYHIPKEMTFPISLWGEEWTKTGRKTPKDPRG